MVRNEVSRRGHGFTLVELLVVIAIITILAGLLLPALARAKDAAKLTVDLSNAKQFATMNLMYCDDNDGRFPFATRSRHGGSSSDYFDWEDWDHYRLDAWEGLEPYEPRGVGGCLCFGEPFKKDYGTNTQGRNRVIALGWTVLVGRDNNYRIVSNNEEYKSPQSIRVRPGSNSSNTMFLCRGYFAPNASWSSVLAHAPRMQKITFKNSPVIPEDPDGQVVARLDNSVAFVGWKKLARVEIKGSYTQYIWFEPSR